MGFEGGRFCAERKRIYMTASKTSGSKQRALSADGIRAVGAGAIVGVGENALHVDTLEEEDFGAGVHFEASGNPDGLGDASLFHKDVRAAEHAGDE